MIAANELRKGNCVKYQNAVCIVSQIFWNRLETMTIIEREKKFQESSYEDIEPIPLTVDILNRCNFIKQERFHYSNVFYSKEGNFIINQLRDSCEVSYGLDGNLAIISKRSLYLHQLQNLYFAVTAEELQIAL
jgi:hypothetical protein